MQALMSGDKTGVFIDALFKIMFFRQIHNTIVNSHSNNLT